MDMQMTNRVPDWLTPVAWAYIMRWSGGGASRARKEQPEELYISINRSR